LEVIRKMRKTMHLEDLIADMERRQKSE